MLRMTLFGAVVVLLATACGDDGSDGTAASGGNAQGGSGSAGKAGSGGSSAGGSSQAGSGGKAQGGGGSSQAGAGGKAGQGGSSGSAQAGQGGSGGSGGSSAGSGGSSAGSGGSTAGSGGKAGSGGSTAGSGGSGGSTAGQGGSAGSGGSSGAGGSSAGSGGSSAGSGGSSAGAGGGAGTGGSAGSGGLPPAGNPNPEATCDIPADAQAENTSKPTTVVGTGTAASCTSKAVVDAVAKGGIITFNCGPAPVTITLTETAKVFNNTGPKIVLDGGGKVTLSGGGKRRILYMNTCDEKQVWTTPQCQNQDHPQLTVQNLTFVDGNSTGQLEEGGGGGAIFVRGGRFKVVNSRFARNECDKTGPDLGGGALRVLSQYQGLPVYVVNSTFGGAEGLGGTCSNGGGISSIGVSWTIINSLFSYNHAVGNGGNPAQPGTPGGGSGGAIYNDGNEMTLRLCGTRIEHNQVKAHGSAIFFVSNNHTGQIFIDRSVITNNIGGSWYPKYPQLSHHDDTPVTVTDSTIK